MKVIDPQYTLGALATDPEAAKARKAKWFVAGNAALDNVLLWRLYSGEDPCGPVIQATATEAQGWNKNSRAFAAWQYTLGRNALPIFELREEQNPELAVMWKVTYKVGPTEDVELVCAMSKADARREFNKLARVTWIVKSIDPHNSQPKIR